jgi:hypothetical protein
VTADAAKGNKISRSFPVKNVYNGCNQLYLLMTDADQNVLAETSEPVTFTNAKSTPSAVRDPAWSRASVANGRYAGRLYSLDGRLVGEVHGLQQLNSMPLPQGTYVFYPRFGLPQSYHRAATVR